MKKMEATEKSAGKGAKSRADANAEKRLQKMQAAFDKKVLAMNFEDFKKTFLESIKEIEHTILETVTWNAEQRDLFVEVFGKGIKQINDHLKIADENFQTLNRRLHDLEGFTAMMGIKFKEALQRKPMTFEERKGLAECVSINWGKGEEKTYNASMQ